jgi:hypothetical protein
MPKSFKIAYCTDISELHSDGFRNQSTLLSMPGSFWLFILYNNLKSNKIEFVSGDIALVKVINKDWNPEEVIIIQEQRSYHGYQLIKQGAIPLIILCLESPLYAYRFYDNLKSIANKFYYRIFFSGFFENIKFDFGNNKILKFPNYDSKSNFKLNWSERKDDIVLVASNKNLLTKTTLNLTFRGNFSGIYYNILDYFTFYFSKNRKLAVKNQLLSKRQKFIEYITNTFSLTIYGSNWDNLLNTAFNKENLFIKGKCEDKIKEMSRYKFAICFENTRYNGYITEKIIDCFASGVIPIYLGATDINIHIPANCYIDFDKFSSLNELCRFLENISEEKANSYIFNGKKFLENNQHYSYNFFADNILNYIINFININAKN